MAAARSPSSSKSSNHNPNRKAVASSLSKSWNGSEFPQRNTASKSASPIPSPPAFFEQKENEREPNGSRQVKTKPSKGMKSFMAPTISASSKITAASPRKKILAERNQVVRESSECSIVSAEEVKQEEEIRRKSEISIGSEEISGQKMSRKLDFSGSKDHHQPLVTHSHDSGALVDDLSLPPYDPMKNYLSPRPQFLHYKPNPKIVQQDLLYAGDVRRLEDSFSDSDDPGNAADCSGKVEDDETLMMTQEGQVSLEIHVSKPKPRSIKRCKLIPFVLILTVMSFCIPFIDSPLLTPLMAKYQSFVDPNTLLSYRVLQDIHFHDYFDVANRNLHGLATRMRQWPKNFIEIFSSFGSFPIELDLSRSLNTTISSSSMVQSKNLDICYRSGFELAGKKNVINEQDDVDSMEIEFQLDKTYVEQLAGNGSAERIIVEFSNEEEALADERVVTEKIKVEFSNEEEALADERVVTEMIKVELSGEEDNFPKYEKRLILFTNPLAKFETISKIEQPEKIEIAKSEEVYVGFNLEALEKEGIDFAAYPLVELQMTQKKDFGDVPLNFLTELQPFIPSGKNLVLAVLGMFFAASMVYLFIKSKQIVLSTGKKSRRKKTKLAPDATKRDLNSHGGLVELLSDSGPTEMSSSFKKSLHRREMSGYPATPSPEITERRESAVSSSVSYGSFTSFEWRSRSARKGSKEEEVMTPVRRSSRIRNQVSSP